MATETPTAPWKAWTAFVSCVLIWGSTFLVIRIGNATLPPVWAATLRLVLAAVVLFAILAVTRQPVPRGAALRAAAGYGLFQFGGNFPLLYWGETVVPSGLAAVIFATIPLSTALFARAFGLEKLTRTKIFGALVALGGVALIMSERLGEHAELLPMLAILLATWVACLGTIILKRGPKQSAIGANAVACVVGAVVCLAISFLIREPHPIPTEPNALLPVVYLAIAGSVGAFVIFSWLITHWEITRSSYIAVLLPVVALTLGALVLGERFSLTAIAGSAVVLAGVAIGLHLIRWPAARPAIASEARRSP